MAWGLSGGGGLRWGWGSASGAALLPDPLLSSLVVTGATSGIGRAYAREVSQGAEPCGWWGFRLWSETPVGLRVAYFIGFPRTLSLLQGVFPLLPSLPLLPFAPRHVFTRSFYRLLAFPHHRPGSFIQSLFMDVPIFAGDLCVQVYEGYWFVVFL